MKHLSKHYKTPLDLYIEYQELIKAVRKEYVNSMSTVIPKRWMGIMWIKEMKRG